MCRCRASNRPRMTVTSPIEVMLPTVSVTGQSEKKDPHVEMIRTALLGCPILSINRMIRGIAETVMSTIKRAGPLSVSYSRITPHAVGLSFPLQPISQGGVGVGNRIQGLIFGDHCRSS